MRNRSIRATSVY